MLASDGQIQIPHNDTYNRMAVTQLSRRATPLLSTDRVGYEGDAESWNEVFTVRFFQ